VDRDVDAVCTAQYLARMGDICPRLAAAQGLGSEVGTVRAANPPHGRGAGVVPAAARALLDEFTAYGPADRVQHELQRWAGAVPCCTATSTAAT
jgi:hypothetical protein